MVNIPYMDPMGKDRRIPEVFSEAKILGVILGCLLLVIYGSRWVLPSWNYHPPIFAIGH